EAIKDTDKDIGKYMYKFMKQFMNNRIGTYLKETEITNMRKLDSRNFNKGNIVVYEDGSSSYKFVMYLNVNGGVATILTKNSPTDSDIIEMTVPVTSLYSYSKIEPISQTFKINESILTEEELLETYIMN